MRAKVKIIKLGAPFYIMGKGCSLKSSPLPEIKDETFPRGGFYDYIRRCLEGTQTQFVDTKGSTLEGIECFWNLVVKGDKLNAVLIARVLGKKNMGYDYVKIVQVVYPNLNSCASRESFIVPPFKSEFSPLVVQIFNTENYSAKNTCCGNNNTNKSPKCFRVIKSILKHFFKGHYYFLRTLFCKSKKNF